MTKYDYADLKIRTVGSHYLYTILSFEKILVLDHHQERDTFLYPFKNKYQGFGLVLAWYIGPLIE